MSNRHIGSLRQSRHLITPVILAGGMGTRLFPTSTAACPKQFVPHQGGESLFQKTLGRVQNRSLFYAPFIIANQHHAALVKDQAHFNHTILYEPVARNTAAAVVISALHLLEKGRETALILPSDHIIQTTKMFHEALNDAISHIHHHHEHVLFGIHAGKASSEFGYIQANHFGHVTHFQEKPTPQIARDLIASSPYTYWNSGIVALNLPLMIKQLKTIAPEFLVRCQIASTNPTENNYNAIPPLAFDRLYLEYSPSLFCIEAEFDWMDIGMQPELLHQSA